jgi:hypothetical protein
MIDGPMIGVQREQNFHISLVKSLYDIRKGGITVQMSTTLAKGAVKLQMRQLEKVV